MVMGFSILYLQDSHTVHILKKSPWFVKKTTLECPYFCYEQDDAIMPDVTYFILLVDSLQQTLYFVNFFWSLWKLSNIVQCDVFKAFREKLLHICDNLWFIFFMKFGIKVLIKWDLVLKMSLKSP